MVDEFSGESPILEFPCDISIKVIGKGNDEFEAAVLTIIHKHFPNLGDRAIQSRDSKNANYRALSITVHAESKDQLDNLYRDLSAAPQVIMAL